MTPYVGRRAVSSTTGGVGSPGDFDDLRVVAQMRPNRCERSEAFEGVPCRNLPGFSVAI